MRAIKELLPSCSFQVNYKHPQLYYRRSKQQVLLSSIDRLDRSRYIDTQKYRIYSLLIDSLLLIIVVLIVVSPQMELDVYIEEYSLAFEYQGEHHYDDHFLYGVSTTQQQKDDAKRKACKAHNITLIEIPYWWDGSTHSLLTTLSERRPDLPLLTTGISKITTNSTTTTTPRGTETIPSTPPVHPHHRRR